MPPVTDSRSGARFPMTRDCMDTSQGQEERILRYKHAMVCLSLTLSPATPAVLFRHILSLLLAINMLSVATYVAASVITIIFVYRKCYAWNKYYRRLAKMPGPTPHFLLGNLSLFYQKGKPLTHSEFIAFVSLP